MRGIRCKKSCKSTEEWISVPFCDKSFGICYGYIVVWEVFFRLIGWIVLLLHSSECEGCLSKILLKRCLYRIYSRGRNQV